MFKEEKTNGRSLDKCEFQKRFLFFSNICSRYILKLPLLGNPNGYLQYLSFHLSLFIYHTLFSRLLLLFL